MGLFSFSDHEIAGKAIDAAQAAWDAGQQLFGHQLTMGVGAKNDDDQLLNLALDGIARIGWELHTVAPYIDTIGPNREVALLVFRRPSSGV